MDNVAVYRQIIEGVLSDYAAVPYAHGEIQTQRIFDRENDHYLLVKVGWSKRRVYGVIVHLDIINEKIWIQNDNTEYGIAADLEAAGIPKEKIVLAFHPPDIRRHTEYAAA